MYKQVSYDISGGTESEAERGKKNFGFLLIVGKNLGDSATVLAMVGTGI